MKWPDAFGGFICQSMETALAPPGFGRIVNRIVNYEPPGFKTLRRPWVTHAWPCIDGKNSTSTQSIYYLNYISRKNKAENSRFSLKKDLYF